MFEVSCGRIESSVDGLRQLEKPTGVGLQALLYVMCWCCEPASSFDDALAVGSRGWQLPKEGWNVTVPVAQTPASWTIDVISIIITFKRETV